MELIIKSSTKTFWNEKDRSQKPTSIVLFWSSFYYTDYRLVMLHAMLDFSENEGDSRKLKKMEKLVQYFSERRRDYVRQQNTTYKHWWKFEINYEEDREKASRKMVFCTNLKRLENVVLPYVVCRTMVGKISYIQKRHMNESICFHFYLWLVDI